MNAVIILMNHNMQILVYFAIYTGKNREMQAYQ